MSLIKHVAIYVELDHVKHWQAELHLRCIVCSRNFNAFAKLATGTKAQQFWFPSIIPLSLIPIYHPALSNSHLSSRSLWFPSRNLLSLIPIYHPALSDSHLWTCSLWFPAIIPLSLIPSYHPALSDSQLSSRSLWFPAIIPLSLIPSYHPALSRSLSWATLLYLWSNFNFNTEVKSHSIFQTNTTDTCARSERTSFYIYVEAKSMSELESGGWRLEAWVN